MSKTLTAVYDWEKDLAFRNIDRAAIWRSPSSVKFWQSYPWTFLYLGAVVVSVFGISFFIH